MVRLYRTIMHRRAVDNIELVSLTTNSRYVTSTQANDADGALRGVQYEVDGANVHFQFWKI